MEFTTISLEIAKRVFQAHGVDAAGKAVLRRKLGSQAAECISANGHGPREQAGQMAAPDRSAETSDRPCVEGAVHTRVVSRT